ncbi:hypothetical protein AX16_000993 [Volvariella volvacea WC 439]|nr:hypothetical protein AX16_000993 [Volvariella volvacea WC 439]
MALVAHIDSGKTTLTESILLKSSYLIASGSVDTGSTTTDFLPAERERGITIQSASIPVKWKDWTFNLIDTPGHADFGMEVESASRVVDGAVVLIDSVEGVESQTKGVWGQLDRYEVATRMVFLNKLDRPGASFKHSLSSLLRHRLHPNPMPLALPVASFNPTHYTQAEPGVCGIVDLVKWEVWNWNKGEAQCTSLPRTATELQNANIFPKDHPMLSHLIPARIQLLENLSMTSESLMETLLSLPSAPDAYLSLKQDAIIPHLRQATLSNEVLPVLCGSAVNNIGTELVLDYVGELFASPLDVSRSNYGQNAPLRALAWKVSWDPKRGWMTFIRIYSGKLSRQSTILNTSANQKERVSKLLLLYASEAVEVDELPFGSVGVILGLKHTRTGDTLTAAGGPLSTSTLRDITPPPAVISASVIPHSHSDLEPVVNALQSLIRTDPSVRMDTQEGQTLVHALGELHLEIVEGRLRDEWNAKFEFGPRKVSYREGLGSGLTSNTSNEWQTEVGGKTVTIRIDFKVRPLEPDEEGDASWGGNIVVDVEGKSLPSPEANSGTPEGYIARGIGAALANSPHTSLAMSQVYVELEHFSAPPGIPYPVLSGASAVILRRLITSAGPGPLMEPYIRLKVAVQESTLGKIVKDLTEHGGEILDLGGSLTEEVGGFPEVGVYTPPEWISPSHSTLIPKNHPSAKRSIQAMAPLNSVLDYSRRLRSLSGGHGTYELANAGFRPVSDSRRQEILVEIGRASFKY